MNQILAREKVPNFKEALKLVVKEESTRHLRSDLKANPESVAFATRRGKELQGQLVSKDHKEGKQRYVKGDPNTDPKAHLFYTNCKKHRHTVETCWDIHGKPKNYGRSNVAATSGDSEEWAKNIPKNPQPPGPQIHPFDLNQAKSVNLQEELETLRNALSHSSFAKTSKFFAICMSITVNPTSTYKSGWTLDSGATNYMTADISCLENFSSITVKKGVITAGGHISPVFGVGNVRFRNIGILHGVLYVPNLTANLISLHRLRPNLRCQIMFDDDICFFIDKNSGKDFIKWIFPASHDSKASPNSLQRHPLLNH